MKEEHDQSHSRDMSSNASHYLLRHKSQLYYLDENDKTEALLSYAGRPDVYLKNNGKVPLEINELLNKFYTWKNQYFHLIKSESLTGTVFVLLCITFGSGILSLPYTFKCVGVVLGLILFLLCAFVSYFTLTMLVDLAYKHDVMDYCVLVEKYFDHKVVIATEVVNLISNLGTIIVYQQFISNFVMSALIYFGIESLGYSLTTIKFFQMYLFCLIFQIPASTVKNIRPLHILSLVGIGFLFYILFISMLELPFYHDINYPQAEIAYFDFNFNIFSVICVYFFCFANHNVVLSIISDLKGDKPTRRQQGMRAVDIQFYVEFILYIIVMFIGYLSTYQNTNEIYIDRPTEGLLILIGKVLYVVGLTCDIGLYYYISRPQLEMFYYNNLTSHFSSTLNVLISTLIILALNTLSFFCTKVTIVIGLIGGTCQIYLMFYLPIMMYLKEYEASLSSYKKVAWKFILGVIIFVGGVYSATVFLNFFVSLL